jgi:hypothetical protein
MTPGQAAICRLPAVQSEKATNGCFLILQIRAPDLEWTLASQIGKVWLLIAVVVHTTEWHYTSAKNQGYLQGIKPRRVLTRLCP